MDHHHALDEFEVKEFLMNNMRIIQNIDYVGCGGYCIKGLEELYDFALIEFRYISEAIRCPVSECRTNLVTLPIAKHWDEKHKPVNLVYGCMEYSNKYLTKENLYVHQFSMSIIIVISSGEVLSRGQCVITLWLSG